MSKYNRNEHMFSDGNRRAQIDALRNSAPPNPYFVALVVVIEDIHRELVQERTNRKRLQEDLASLKKERLVA